MVERERISGYFLTPDWVRREHAARFHFSAAYAKDKNVLDCACGTGVGTAIFAEKAAHVTAFDISDEALEDARKHCTATNVTFQKGSATALPVADGFADVYISLETIEHIEEDKAYLKEPARVTKAGGLFICSTPNRRVTNPGKTINQKPANIWHIREYDEAEFVANLKNHFSKVEIFGQNPNLKFKVAILRFLGGFLPFHLAVRLHQLDKLICHPFRSSKYYDIHTQKGINVEFEYMTAVCTK